MSETIVEASPVAVAAEKKVAKKNSAGGAVKKSPSVPSHPPTQQMVDASLKMLKERGGSSLVAIKKYIAATYKVDAQKLAPFIKKYLKGAVASGKIVQPKGNGAAGSFKLSAAAGKEPKNPKVKSGEKKKPPVTAASKKSVATKKVVSSKSAGGDKKVKKSAAKVEKPKAEKKKIEKTTSKIVKKAEIVKAKVPKAKAASPTKSKVSTPKAKAPLSKAKKTVGTLKKPATVKKITTKK